MRWEDIPQEKKDALHVNFVRVLVLLEPSPLKLNQDQMDLGMGK